MGDRRFDFRQVLLTDEVSLQWMGPAGTLTQCAGTLSDLSISGVGVKVDQPIRLQTAVVVTLRGKELRGKVQNCTRILGRYLVGLQFGVESRGIFKPSL